MHAQARVKVEAGSDNSIIVLTGLNATGKSIAARTAHVLVTGDASLAESLHCLGGVEGRVTSIKIGLDKRAYEAKLECSNDYAVIEKVKAELAVESMLIPDARLSLRALLADIGDLTVNVHEAAKQVREVLKSSGQELGVAALSKATEDLATIASQLVESLKP